jgi:drug/metabolite transporter (DMT)-like permease
VTVRHEANDWVMLGALTLMWGSSFLFTKLAVAGLAFEQVVTARLLLAALILVPIAVALGRSVPREPRAWLFLGLIALVGNLLPFSLITWGQRAIDSGLAGILMAVMPLATLGLAHLFVPGERLSRNRLIGFLLGFSGVVVLIGPEALLAIGGERGSLLPMLAVLAGAICYGVSAILSRLRPTRDALTTAAAVTSLAALLSLPGAIGAEVGSRPLVSVTPAVIGSVAFLGLFSTAIAMIVYFRLIQTAGPGFTSQLNYLIPLWAVALGLLFLGETPTLGHLVGLILILAGIVVARRPPRPGPHRSAADAAGAGAGAR